MQSATKKVKSNNRLLIIGGIIIFSSIILSFISAIVSDFRIEMMNSENISGFFSYFFTNIQWLNLFSWIFYFGGLVVTFVASVKTLSFSFKTRNFKSKGSIAAIAFLIFFIGISIGLVLTPNNPGIIMFPLYYPWII